jgi:DNA processing protein
MNDTERKLTPEEQLDRLQLHLSKNVGPTTFHQLIGRFGTASTALAALAEPGAAGTGKRRITLYARDKAKSHLDRLRQLDARMITHGEPGYPQSLHHTEPAPPVLFAKGRIELLPGPAVAMVGARNASAAGRKLAGRIARELGKHGMVVISGLARGIDAAAHEAALATGTIAVLAGGLDVPYPPENKDLHNEIAQNGLLISERLPGARPNPAQLSRRNRLIAGLSLGVVILEAARKSGALGTAGHAADYGRLVFAVPGSPLDPRAYGTNELIKQGAIPTTGAPDIIQALSPLIRDLPALAKPVKPRKTPPARRQPVTAPRSPEDLEARVLEALTPDPASIDEIGRLLGISMAELHVVLVELELDGRIIRHGQQAVSLA